MKKYINFNKSIIFIIIFTLMLMTGCSNSISEPIIDDINTEVNNNIVTSEDTKLTDDEKLTSVSKDDFNSNNEMLEVHYIDVGQGDAILIKQGESNMLIDAGENHKGPEVVTYLKQQNITTLEYVIGTHPHSDHIGGLDDVIHAFDVKRVIMPNKSHTTKTFEDVLNAIQSKNLKITKPTVGDVYDLGNAKFTIIGPNNSSYSNLNDYSVAIRVEYGNNSFMFTGDAEKISEQEMVNNDLTLKSDVLKAGHHGSNTSNMESFVNKVNPDYVVIQVGKENKYNHPNDDIIERFKSRNIQIYQTNIHGNIVAYSDGNNITFKNATKDDSISNKYDNSNQSSQTVISKNPNNEIENIKNEVKNLSEVEFVGTKSTKVFHISNCKYVAKPENRINFKSKEEALSAGYRGCKVCNAENQ